MPKPVAYAMAIALGAAAGPADASAASANESRCGATAGGTMIRPKRAGRTWS